MQLMFAPPVKAFPQPAILATRRAQRFESSLLSPRVASARLSLIARPDRETAVRMAALAARLRMERGLSGQPLPAEQFHVRLFQADEISGRAPGLLSERIEAARERAASVSMPSFRVAFDRAGSFDNGACGLHGEAGTMGLEVLHQRLEDAFDGTPRPARAFTPSITNSSPATTLTTIMPCGFQSHIAAPPSSGPTKAPNSQNMVKVVLALGSSSLVKARPSMVSEVV